MQHPPAESEYTSVPTMGEAVTLLEKAGADSGLWAHTISVATVALHLAAALLRRGEDVDVVERILLLAAFDDSNFRQWLSQWCANSNKQQYDYTLVL